MFEECAITTNRIQAIIEDKAYKKYYKKNTEAEKKREFCKHDMTHFMDVARIAIILNEKAGGVADEELIYATALLHDIGRFKQYEKSIPHEQASAELAPDILVRCGFDSDESAKIVKAILEHRNKEVKDELSLAGLIYRADKLSRPCFACAAQKNCNWKDDKKNLVIKI